VWDIPGELDESARRTRLLHGLLLLPDAADITLPELFPRFRWATIANVSRRLTVCSIVDVRFGTLTLMELLDPDVWLDDDGVVRVLASCCWRRADAAASALVWRRNRASMTALCASSLLDRVPELWCPPPNGMEPAVVSWACERELGRRPNGARGRGSGRLLAAASAPSDDVLDRTLDDVTAGAEVTASCSAASGSCTATAACPSDMLICDVDVLITSTASSKVSPGDGSELLWTTTVVWNWLGEGSSARSTVTITSDTPVESISLPGSGKDVWNQHKSMLLTSKQVSCIYGHYEKASATSINVSGGGEFSQRGASKHLGHPQCVRPRPAAAPRVTGNRQTDKQMDIAAMWSLHFCDGGLTT